ncbi:MAG: hypothetical protein WCW61_02725 [Patescibacteria group bacterium]
MPALAEGDRTGWKRFLSDGGSRSEKKSVGRSSGGASDANQGQVSPPAGGRAR